MSGPRPLGDFFASISIDALRCGPRETVFGWLRAEYRSCECLDEVKDLPESHYIPHLESGLPKEAREPGYSSFGLGSVAMRNNPMSSLAFFNRLGR